MPSDRVRILRVIARLNIGGPAHQAALLSGRLDPDRFETLLVAGRPGRGEGSFEDLARRYGARMTLLPSLSPHMHPAADLRSLHELRRIVREFGPQIVHTHTAKAGALGRTAALLASRRRPVIVHTYHGHVLEGYFGPGRTAGYREVERGLARFTDRLVGVSQATVDDLVRLGVAGRERFSLVPLGLELGRFLSLDPRPDRDARAGLGVGAKEVIALYAGRLVPIKEVDVLLRAVARARNAGAPLRLLVLGDGELRPELERLAGELGIAANVTFLGYRTNVVSYLAAADLGVLSSANEGTPVALIEAAAAARPLVGTRVGGVADVVAQGTGRLVGRGDAEALAGALTELAENGGLRRELGARAREHVRVRYTGERLLADIDALYRELLAARGRDAT
jgi:glycosyltransferase involved in cell wall biosynthesis